MLSTVNHPKAAAAAIALGLASVVGIGAYEMGKSNAPARNDLATAPRTETVATAPGGYIAPPDNTALQHRDVGVEPINSISRRDDIGVAPPLPGFNSNNNATTRTVTHYSATVPANNAVGVVPSNSNVAQSYDYGAAPRPVTTSSMNRVTTVMPMTTQVPTTYVRPINRTTLIEQTPQMAYVPAAPTQTVIERRVVYRRPLYVRGYVYRRYRGRNGKIHVVRAIKHSVTFVAKLPGRLRL